MFEKCLEQFKKKKKKNTNVKVRLKSAPGPCC